MKRIWSSRIWIICSQMLYCGLLLDDVHVHLSVKGKCVLPEEVPAEDSCSTMQGAWGHRHSRHTGWPLHAGQDTEAWREHEFSAKKQLDQPHSPMSEPLSYLLTSVFWKRNYNFSLISQLLSKKLGVVATSPLQGRAP